MTLRLIAEHADIWHGFGKPEELAHKNRVLDDWCAGSGRDPGEIERSGGVPGSRFGDPSYGDALVAAGTTQLTFGMGGPAFDLAFLPDWVAWRDERNEGGEHPPPRRPGRWPRLGRRGRLPPRGVSRLGRRG